MVEFDPFTPAAIADPYPQYLRCREAGEVFYSERVRSWVLFSYRDVQAFFNEPTFSSDRSTATKYSGTKPTIRSIGTDPPEHTPVRGTITQSLYPMVRTLLPAVEDLVGDMTDQLVRSVERFLDENKPDSEADLIEDFAYPLPIAVIADLFGVPETDRAQFQNWSHDMARMMDRFYAKKSGMDMEGFKAYFRAMIDDRRTSPGDDLISRMLDLEFDEPLNNDELVGLCTTLIFAGHETTTNLIGNGMLALLRDEAELERLRNDSSGLAETAVEEFLRFDAPAQMISRTVTEDTNFAGVDMLEGDAVLAVLGSANRDDVEFGSTAERLDVGRHPNYHLSFGLGRHFCPGARLSRLEAKVAIPVLMERLPQLRLGTEPPTFRQTAVLRGLERLPVRV